MIKHLLRKVVFCSFLLSVSLTVHAQDLDYPLPIDPSVTTGKLANGLKYYIKPNAKPEKKVELRLVVNAGSILENDQQQGLAHFMEHMNFNGTKHYPKNALVDFLQSIGIQFGADLNAYTSFDETVFILPIPTDKVGNLDKGFQVLADWAQAALLTDKDINEERKVVLEESRGGKGAEDRMMKIYLPKLLAGSHYADRLPIGKDDILKTFKPASIRSFYKDWYRPDLMAVAVVGAITPEEGKKLVEKYFSSLKNPANEKPRTKYDVPAFKNQDAMVLTDKEATNKQYSIVFSSKKQQEMHSMKDYRSAIVRNLFIQMLNNRLQELTQSAKPPFVYSYAYIEGWARGYESFQIMGSASGDVETGINASVGELVKIEQYGFTASELVIAKKRLLSAVEKMYKERNTTESGRIINEYVRNFLTEDPIPGIENEYKYNKELMPTITLKETNIVAFKYLGDHSTFFALATSPEDKENKKMSNEELLVMVQKAFQQKVEPRAEKITALALLDKEPTSGKIVSEQKDNKLGTTTYTLSNGVKVTVKPTTFKSDEIVMNGLKKGGQGQYTPVDKSNATMMTQVVEAMGYGKFTPTDLKDFLSGKVLSVSNSMGAATNNINASSSVNDFETMLQLVYLKLTAAHKNEELFTGFIAKQKASLEFVKSNPQYAFFDTLNKTLYNNDPRASITIPTTQDLDKINADRVLEMFNNEYGNADGFNFYIVGNVNETAIKPLLEKYIASLPAKGTTPMYNDNGLRPISGNHQLQFSKGAEQKSMIIGQYYGTIPFSEDLELKAHLVTDILNIKIIEELREKIGGIYSGGMASDVRRVPYSRYQIQLYLPCGPESVDTLLKAADLEIANIKKNGPSEKDLAKVKQAQLEKYREDVKKNSYWSSNLQGILFWGNDKERFLEYEKVINMISAVEIKETANLLFDGKNSLKSVLYPEVIEVKK
jgi:zinc protease